MSKKEQKRIEAAEKQIIKYAKDLTGSKPGGLHFRIILNDVERWISVRKGLLTLRDMGDL